jgi:hypothetical protein
VVSQDFRTISSQLLFSDPSKTSVMPSVVTHQYVSGIYSHGHLLIRASGSHAEYSSCRFEPPHGATLANEESGLVAHIMQLVARAIDLGAEHHARRILGKSQMRALVGKSVLYGLMLLVPSFLHTQTPEASQVIPKQDNWFTHPEILCSALEQQGYRASSGDGKSLEYAAALPVIRRTAGVSQKSSIRKARLRGQNPLWHLVQ